MGSYFLPSSSRMPLSKSSRPGLAEMESRPSLKGVKCKHDWVKVKTEYHRILFDAKPLLQLASFVQYADDWADF